MIFCGDLCEEMDDSILIDDVQSCRMTSSIDAKQFSRLVALSGKRFHALPQFRNRFAELVSVSYKFGLQRLDVALQVVAIFTRCAMLLRHQLQIDAEPLDLFAKFPVRRLDIRDSFLAGELKFLDFVSRLLENVMSDGRGDAKH